MDVGLTAVQTVVEVKKVDTFAQQKTGNLTEKVLRRSRQRRWKEGAFFQSIASMKERTVQKSAQTCHLWLFLTQNMELTNARLFILFVKTLSSVVSPPC